MIKKVDHIAVVVKNLDEALQLYDSLFGLKPSQIEFSPEYRVKMAFLPMAEGCEIELLEPIDPQSGIGKFLETQGEGIHHICLEVDNVDQELCTLANKGVQLIDKQGRPGVTGKIAFLNPTSTKGVLIELLQKV